MSLTAHILFAAPTTLLQGQPRTHRMNGKWVDEIEGTKAVDCKVSAAAVERVFNAVESGLRTTNEIGDKKLISVTVVKRALVALENWPGGPRIRRIKSFPAHRFEVVK